MHKGTQNVKLKTKNFLEEVVEKKKADLFRKTQITGVSESQKFKKADSLFLKLFKRKDKKLSFIAEIKFASPTNPHLGSSDELLQRAKQYEKAGADAISIITEKYYFKGDTSFVSQVKKEVSIPVLQKDFVIDPSQIYEAKEIGSDALLLIARLVDVEVLKQFVELCFSLEIEPVVEIASEEDFGKAVVTQTNIIAVNARDLESFVVDVKKACLLIRKIPDHFIKFGFSGIHSSREVKQYQKAGAKGVLVGTGLMEARDIDNFVNELMS